MARKVIKYETQSSDSSDDLQLNEPVSSKVGWKKWLPSIVSSFILLGTIGVVSTISFSQSQTLSKEQDEKIALKNQIDQLSLQSNTTVTRVKAQVGGIDANRVQDDDAAVGKVLGHVFSWSSYDEYTKIRDELKNTYHLSDNSSFLKVFMPDIYNEEIDGKQYNSIDVNGYNIHYNGMTSYVVGMDSNTNQYSYFTVVSVSSSSHNGGSEDYELALKYTTDSSHNILTIEGYALK